MYFRILLSIFLPQTHGFLANHVNWTTSSSFRKTSTLYRATTISRQDNYKIETISDYPNPKCYIVKNFLDPQSCEAYISRASKADPSLMRRSSAPDVSVQISKLWPLPFLSLGAGIPPVIRSLESGTDNGLNGLSIENIISQALPAISVAFCASIGLVFLVTAAVKAFATNTRTSESLPFNREEDCEFISELVNRASSITGHPWDQWEAPVFTKYSQGALFASHNDASPKRGEEWINDGGQRVVTVIIYLNTCNIGGGTKFNRLGFTVQPEQGSALVFFPADANTLEADERTIHQSLPAVEEKCIVQLFGRVNRVPSPLGIPESFIDYYIPNP